MKFERHLFSGSMKKSGSTYKLWLKYLKQLVQHVTTIVSFCLLRQFKCSHLLGYIWAFHCITFNLPITYSENGENLNVSHLMNQTSKVLSKRFKCCSMLLNKDHIKYFGGWFVRCQQIWPKSAFEVEVNLRY